MNFLHQDTTADLPTLTERLKNSYKFFGDDVVRTGGIGEFIGGGTGANNNIFVEAAKRIARRLARRGSLAECDGFPAGDPEL